MLASYSVKVHTVCQRTKFDCYVWVRLVARGHTSQPTERYLRPGGGNTSKKLTTADFYPVYFLGGIVVEHDECISARAPWKKKTKMPFWNAVLAELTTVKCGKYNLELWDKSNKVPSGWWTLIRCDTHLGISRGNMSACERNVILHSMGSVETAVSQRRRTSMDFDLSEMVCLPEQRNWGGYGSVGKGGRDLPKQPYSTPWLQAQMPTVPDETRCTKCSFYV